ncbi:MAG: NTP transferase domain-containing protein [Pseudomonadota bacterium]
MEARHPPSPRGLILCGGAGRRAGGIDKPLASHGGRPLVAAIAERLQPQVTGPLMISANRNQRRYTAWGTVIADRWPGFAGPLAGIASVLAALQRTADTGRTPQRPSQTRVVVCPGDAPTVPVDLVARLSAAVPGNAVAPPHFIHDGERAQPLFALLTLQHLPGLMSYLRSGRRSVLGWLDESGGVAVQDPRPELYQNLNRPQQAT